MIAIIVPSRYPEIFKQCSDNLNQLAPKAFKFLVRDGNDIECPVGWFQVQGPESKFVYARNVNLGIKEALKIPEVTSVLLMNDDVQFTQYDTLERLESALKIAGDEVGILSPKIDGNACNPTQTTITTQVEIINSDFVTFVCVLLTRKLIEKIGFLDETFTGYGSDDVDQCRRAKLAGFKLAITASVTVTHGFNDTRSSASYLRQADQDKLAEDNRRRYIEKWGRRTEGAFQDEGTVLIGIRSCVRDAKRGDNQASRDTWIKDIKYYGYDYKFFIGDGTPTGEPEPPNVTDWGWQYKGRKQEKISEIVPKSDEEILRCPDDYFHMPYKTREICRYAVKNKYDYLFCPCDDVYVDIYRLYTSGYQGKDYIGNKWGGNSYAHGGPGFWLSKKAFTILANSPVDSSHDDEWVGNVLARHGIGCTHDARYAYDSDQLRNDTIALHLTFITGTYQVSWMYDTAKKWPITIDPSKAYVPPAPQERRCIRTVVRDNRVQRRWSS